MELLKTVKASSPLFPNDQNQLFFVRKTDKITLGFKKLIDNNVLTVPVFDESTRKFTCFLSMTDLVYEILQLTNDADKSDLPQGDISSVVSALIEKNVFKKEIVADVADISKREPFVCVNGNQSLDEVARLMVKNDISRIVVLSDSGELVNLVTSSRIIECVSTLFGMDSGITALGRMKISELNLINRDVITVDTNDQAMKAFELIGRMGISGVGVVDSENPRKLVGVISNTDLGLIKSHAQYMSLLHLTTKDYLQILHNNVEKPVVTCKPTDTFKDLVERIVLHKIHRIFIVDNDNNLCGIVTLQGILENITRSTSAVPISQ